MYRSMVTSLSDGQSIGNKNRHAVTKDRCKQSLSTKWHATQQGFLLFCDSNDGCKVK